MAELNIQTKHTQDYSVKDIFRLAEKFRHLAKDLNQVFIQASRQQIVYQVETDPEEEETREKLHFFRDLGQRFKQRLIRKSYSKPQLVAKKPEPEKLAPVKIETPLRNERKVDRVVIEKDPKPIVAKPAQATSLAEAAARLKTQLGIVEPAQKVEAPVENKTISTALSLKSEELPKYKKYRDIGEQLLEAKQFPHFRTLLEKAREELSPQAIALLEEFGISKGFNP